MELEPVTGRTHQLRVVCESIFRTPIYGDTKYGNRDVNSRLEVRINYFIELIPTLIQQYFTNIASLR